MKAEIHPKYHRVEATCVCGNVLLTGSTRAAIRMDICSACHPFYTGTQKIVDTEGRVEKFKKRFANAEAYKKPDKKAKKSAQTAEAQPVVEAPKAVEAPAAEVAAPVETPVVETPVTEAAPVEAPAVETEAPAEVAPESTPEAAAE